MKTGGSRTNRNTKKDGIMSGRCFWLRNLSPGYVSEFTFKLVVKSVLLTTFIGSGCRGKSNVRVGLAKDSRKKVTINVSMTVLFASLSTLMFQKYTV